MKLASVIPLARIFTARTTIATRSPVPTIAAVTASTISTVAPITVAAVSITALATVIATFHHRRLALIGLIDADSNKANNVRGEAHLPLHLSDRGVRRVNIHEGEVSFAIFPNLESEVLHAPIFGLADLAAKLLDDGLEALLQGGHLLRRDILARKEYVLVMWHIAPFLMSIRAAARSPF
jgi:hypothetical protein